MTGNRSRTDFAAWMTPGWTRRLGIFAAILSVIAQSSLVVPGALRPGLPSVLFSASVLGITVLATALSLRYRWRRCLFPLLVINANIVCGVAGWASYDPLRFASPVMLVIPMIFAAMLLGRGPFMLQCALTPFVLGVATVRAYDDLLIWGIQVAWNTTALVLTGYGTWMLRRRAEQSLIRVRELSNTDPLTGLANRRFVDDHAPIFVAGAVREKQWVAAFVLDLDHFKEINDSHGHQVGDNVLLAVADAVRGCVRAADVAARTGGEEILVLSWVDGRLDAERMAARLHATVGSVRVPTDEGPPVRPTCSVGVAVAEAAAGEGAEWIWRLTAAADASLYQAKHAGRDRWVFAPGSGDRARVHRSATQN
ncbi:MAG: GGDEF domain-containing protein [Actinomycetales bacterium]